jgi:hypothetical protein
VELGRDDELHAVEHRGERADLPLELIERRGGIVRNTSALQPRDE